MKGSAKWQEVEEKLGELERLVEENWDRGEWELALRGESTIRTVEESKATAKEMKERADDYIKTIKTIWPNR